MIEGLWKVFSSWTQRIWGLTLGTLALLGLAYQFAPKVTVAAPIQIALDPVEILKRSFVIENDGALDVVELKAHCLIQRIIYTNKVIWDRSAVENLKDITPILEADGRRSFSCMIAPIFPVAYAEIGVNISFRPAFWPSRVSRTFWFKTQTNKDGSLRWEHLSLSD